MSNIAGKAYAMNVITPMHWYTAWMNRFFFWVSGRHRPFISGLLTLSLIHYARWVIVKASHFPAQSGSAGGRSEVSLHDILQQL
jgi:hypothetical protein